MSKITLERYFYPVGQGLCCRERFISEQGQEFNLVYDCGQIVFWLNPRPAKYISKRIEQCFKDVKIDVLYISHFHTDHVNLLEKIKNTKGCCIRKIILPYLTTYYLLSNVIDPQVPDNEFVNNLLMRAAGYITTVEEDTEYYLLQSSFQDFENSDNFIHNGDNLLKRFSHNLPFWEFLPYNDSKGLDRNIYSYLVQELKKNKINPNSVEDIVGKRKEIKKIYSSIIKNKSLPKINLNEQSTLLLSLPETTKIKEYNFKNSEYVAKENLLGCIYFGDYPVQKGLPPKTSKAINNNIQNVGTIQIPHHGALDGELPGMYYAMRKCPVSYGLWNQKKHPTKHIVETIGNNNGFLVRVSEELGYFQYFEFTV